MHCNLANFVAFGTLHTIVLAFENNVRPPVYVILWLRWNLVCLQSYFWAQFNGTWHCSVTIFDLYDTLYCTHCHLFSLASFQLFLERLEKPKKPSALLFCNFLAFWIQRSLDRKNVGSKERTRRLNNPRWWWVMNCVQKNNWLLLLLLVVVSILATQELGNSYLHFSIT